MRLKPILGKEPAQGGLQTEHDKNIRICTSSERDDIQIVKRVDKTIPGRLTHTECMLLSGIFCTRVWSKSVSLHMVSGQKRG